MAGLHPTPLYRDKVSQLISWGHWFCFSNILLSLILGLRYLVLAKPPETFIGQIYLLVSWAGQFAFIPFVLFLLILFPLSFAIPSFRTLRFIGALLATAGLCALILDLEVYAEYGVHLNPAMFSLLIDKESQTATNFNGFFVLIPFLFLLQLWLGKLCWSYLRRIEHKQLGKPIAAVFILCFLATHLVHAWADAVSYRPVTQQRYNYPLFYPLTARSFLLEQGIFDAYSHAEQVRDELAGPNDLRYPARNLDVRRIDSRMNVLLVIAEGMRWDLLQPDVMPTASAAAASSSQFQSHFTASNQQPLSMFSLLYGLPSSYWPAVEAQQVPPVLTKVLSQQNYQSMAFYNGQTSSVIDLGFEKAQQRRFDSDRELVNEWKGWMDQHANLPWFNLVYLDGIAQFENDLPAPPDLSAETMREYYKASATQLDSLLAQMSKTLADNGVARNTVIILTGDYGIEFNEEGDNSWGFGNSLSLKQSQVPLLIKWPGRTPELFTQDTSHLDLVPTLLQDVLAVNNNASDFSSGQNIFQDRELDWVMIGSEQQQAIVESGRITVFDDDGDYQVIDRQTVTERDRNKVSLRTMVQVMNEMRRFYNND
ncbi:DUF3413 domain-containing protein [Aliagarivorans marinus]|uniref:DUF3413 domain-containing protein n=1 Tax=Aliagarivorans marinus TaxID=561965 RepID=UPI00047E5022|nr:DUF3413 domain-containing protein [Aliagarivorans marinus]